MSHYELDPTPNFTANEMYLLAIIRSLLDRQQMFENAVICNLPNVNNNFHRGYQQLDQIVHELNQKFPEMLLAQGTYRTTSQLDHLEGVDSEIKRLEARADLRAKLPKLFDRSGEHHSGNRLDPLSAIYTREQIYRVFLSMALKVDTLPGPSVEGSGWNVVSLNERIYAYYTYDYPNRVTELMWEGGEIHDQDHPTRYSQTGQQTLIYLPLEQCWMRAQIGSVVSRAERLKAIAELFHTVHGLPVVESISNQDAYQRIAAEHWLMPSWLQKVANQGLVEAIKPYQGEETPRWARYGDETAYFDFTYENRVWQFAISHQLVQWRDNPPTIVVEMFLREFEAEAVVTKAREFRDAYEAELEEARKTREKRNEQS